MQYMSCLTASVRSWWTIRCTYAEVGLVSRVSGMISSNMDYVARPDKSPIQCDSPIIWIFQPRKPEWIRWQNGSIVKSTEYCSDSVTHKVLRMLLKERLNKNSVYVILFQQLFLSTYLQENQYPSNQDNIYILNYLDILFIQNIHIFNS